MCGESHQAGAGLCYTRTKNPSKAMKNKLELQSSERQAKLAGVEKSKGRPMLQWVGKKPLEGIEYYPAQEKEIYGDKNSPDFNKLFWGDNLQVLAHLLKDYRGKIDLIYIDPPFDSKADYIKKVKIRGEAVEGVSQSLLEEKQYTDIWEKDEYLQFMYERLLLMRELLSDTGSIYLHCDWHKSAFLRLILDEVFGEDNFINEIIWWYKDPSGTVKKGFKKKHDNILVYSKTNNFYFKADEVREEYSEGTKRQAETGTISFGRRTELNPFGKYPVDVWEVAIINSQAQERTDYPTQKPEALVEKIIKASSKKGDVIADFFIGSGTTAVAAQKTGRKWIGCDINQGAIQTTVKRLNQIVTGQTNEKDNNFKGLLAFKVLNVNEYDVFKNELEAKELLMQIYGIEPIKLSYFDGILDNNFVKIMPVNRVLNRMDLRNLLKNINDKLDNFTVKKTTKSGDSVYEEGALIIASGVEMDVEDFLRKENKTGVGVEIRDIQTDKNNLIFKKKPEAVIDVKLQNKKLTVEIKQFYSPILMRKLELENEKIIDNNKQAKVGDFRQIIDIVAIDVDYNGKLFNAEILDLPNKKEVIKAKYLWEYEKTGANVVAIKIVDVLGEEYFETFKIGV